MFKALFVSLKLSLCTFACLFTSPTLAQVTTDGTVDTQVNQNGNVAEITGGETRDSNLFHSFQDFSVQTGKEAFFNNADNISNIFSRVTGGNLSNIDGAIRANGSASLFLINPAGIIFGKNARLDIGGSFYGSTASSILFEDGEFSAVDNLAQPILTVNAPIGLGFRDESGDIVNRSRVEDSLEEIVGLEVSSGNNLAFLGGNINFESGQAKARGGNIYLGGLGEAGIVNLNTDGSLNFPEDVTLANVILTNGADVSTTGAGGGNITVDARNLTLKTGEFGSSLIRSGIRSESTNPEAQAGNITIDVAEEITLNESRILNQVDAGGVGNSGNIAITTSSIEAINGGDIDTSTLGEGNAGDINITATGDLSFDRERPSGFAAGVTSFVNSNAVGDAGEITISTSNLNLTNGGRVSTSTFGQGNAGAINVTASGNISIDGEDSEAFPSGITTLVDSDAVGDAGEIAISTSNLNLTNGGRVAADTSSQGNGGAINVTASGNISIDGEDSEAFPSTITSFVNSDAVGDSEGVTISTSNLNLTNGGQVSTSTFGQGNAGAINVTASGDISIDGEDSDGLSSNISSFVNPNAVGNAGDITISTNNLTLTNSGEVTASTFSQGDAGNINISATGDLTFDGFLNGSVSKVTSVVDEDAVGNGGDVTISTNNLTLTNSAEIVTSTSSQGNAGNINIIATGDLTFDSNGDMISSVNSDGVGNAGDINISSNNLTLTDAASISAGNSGLGDSGNVSITAKESVLINGAESPQTFITTNSFVSSDFPDFVSENLGKLEINASKITVTNNALVSTSSSQGISGNLIIRASESFEVTNNAVIHAEVSRGSIEANSSLLETNGNLIIETASLTVANGGQISASIFGSGNAGNLIIRATDSVLITGETGSGSSALLAIAVEENGKGGELDIFTQDLTVSDNAIISVGNFPTIEGLREPGTGEPGDLNVQADSLNVESGGRITAATQFSLDEGANINLNVADNITLRDGGLISAQAIDEGNGGNLNIDTNFIIAFPNGNNDIIASAEQGQGGNININAESLFGIQERPLKPNTNDLNASSEFSLDGTVDVSTPDVNPVQGATELPTNIVVPEETTQQACEVNREIAAKNGLNITGKGGIIPEPGLPLDSLNVTVNSENNSISAIPAPIETSKGKIRPARGVEITKSGEVVLTTYRTNNAGQRIPEIKPNCG